MFSPSRLVKPASLVAVTGVLGFAAAAFATTCNSTLPTGQYWQCSVDSTGRYHCCRPDAGCFWPWPPNQWKDCDQTLYFCRNYDTGATKWAWGAATNCVDNGDCCC